jgi:hypothetical protein
VSFGPGGKTVKRLGDDRRSPRWTRLDRSEVIRNRKMRRIFPQLLIIVGMKYLPAHGRVL